MSLKFSVSYESVNILLLESNKQFKNIKLIVFSNLDITEETFIKNELNLQFSKQQNVIPLLLSGNNFSIFIIELDNTPINIFINNNKINTKNYIKNDESDKKDEENVSNANSVYQTRGEEENEEENEEEFNKQFETITNIFGSQEVSISDLQVDTLDNVGFGLARLLSTKSLNEIKVPEIKLDGNIEFTIKKK